MPARILSEPLIQALGLSGGPIPAQLSRGVARLSQLFTRGRGGLDAAYLDEASLRQAYAAYFLPVNLAKVQCLLDEMPDSTFETPADDPIRVLDLGSGPATGALAVLDWVTQHPSIGCRKLEVHCLDRSPQALRDADLAWKAYAGLARVGAARLVTVEADLRHGVAKALAKAFGQTASPPSFHLIILANCLNEVLGADRQPLKKGLAVIQDCAACLAPTGTLMVVEPALRETARSLHELRNEILAQAAAPLHVYSPCLHEQPCPALVREADWCHEERPWTPPATVAAIDKEVGFIKDALKFSYLLLRKDAERIAPDVPDVYRVVSELRVMKGEKRAWLCNQTGRPEVGRQDRLRSPTNEAFDHWHRGAIVRIDQIVRKEHAGRESSLGRIPPEAIVEIVRPS